MQSKKNLEQIKERFPGKQINRLLSFRTNCPLSMSERLTYSFLAYRCRREGKLIAASIRKLSRLSGMHRDTISKAVHSLKEYNLSQRTSNNKWATNRPGREKYPEWFGWRTQGRDLKDIAYHYFPQPAEKSPLSIIDAMIYLADIFDPGKSNACLAGRFGITWNTVNTSRRKVAGLKYTPDWFMDIQFTQKPQRSSNKHDFLQQFQGAEKYLVSKMMATSQPAWSQQDVSRFLKIAKDHRPTTDGYDNLVYTLVGNGPSGFDAIMQVHREAGSLTDCGIGLLLYRLGLLRQQTNPPGDCF